MSEKYDVIIIGAGIAGLTAAAVLAKRGKKVLLLEKNSVPGGCVVNFKRGRFDFDVALDSIDGFNKGEIQYDILEKCGALNKINFIRPEYLYRAIFPDFDYRVAQSNLEGYINILAGYFPNERKGIEKIYAEMFKIFKEGEKFFISQNKNPFWFELICLPFKYPTILKNAFSSLESMMSRFIQDHRLKALIAQNWQYFGLAPSKLSAFYYSYPMIDFLYNGSHYIKGGGQVLTSSLFEAMQENGGNALLNTPVEKIIIKDNTAIGVSSQKGEFLADMIVSGMDVNKTFFDLVGKDKLDSCFSRKLRKLQPAASAFGVHLGLKVDLKETGFTDYEIFYHPDYDFEKQYKQCINNEMDKVPFFITVHTNADKNNFSPGTGQLKIVTLSGAEFWRGLNKSDYERKKRELGDTLVKRAERIIPNLASYIETMNVVTPLTLERYTGNYGGAIYGFDQLVSQSGLFRLNQNTPIRNLYLTGAWTRPGGGMSAVMISGDHIAEEILKR